MVQRSEMENKNCCERVLAPPFQAIHFRPPQLELGTQQKSVLGELNIGEIRNFGLHRIIEAELELCRAAAHTHTHTHTRMTHSIQPKY